MKTFILIAIVIVLIIIILLYLIINKFFNKIDKKPKIKMNKEESLTIAVADYLRLQYPNVLFTHIANERQTTPQRGAKFKRMGVRKGMPDIMIFCDKMYDREYSLKYYGLAIELKIKPNKLTESQIEVLEYLVNNGWVYEVCYDFDEAQRKIDNYLWNRQYK